MRRIVPLLLLALTACGDGPTDSREAIAPGFLPPLDGGPRTGNVFDHDAPFEFEDDNGYLLSWWGERVIGIDGHDGYDFGVPIGTPVHAVTDGVVTAARAETPWSCPLLGTTVSGLYVRVRHNMAAGVFETLSLHLDRIDVALGQRVKAGEQIGLSGNTGCSTAPHLHFAVRRVMGDGHTVRQVDPYGWDGDGDPDPWAQRADGATSVWLWRDGAAPPLFNEFRWGLPAANVAPAGISRIRWLGVRDATNPSNEFVDVERAAGIASVNLAGWTLQVASGASWTFPSGAVIDAARPVLRVYVGPALEAGSLGMGMTHGIFANMGDCAFLRAPTGSQLTYAIRTPTCAATSPALRRAPVLLPEATPDFADIVNAAATP